MNYAPLKGGSPAGVVSNNNDGNQIDLISDSNIIGNGIDGGSATKSGKNRTISNTGSDLAEPLTGGAERHGDFEIGGDELTMNGSLPPTNNNSVHSESDIDKVNSDNEMGADDDPYYVFKDDLLRKLGMIDESLASYQQVIINTDTAANSHEVKDVKKQLKRHLKHSESTLKDLQLTVRLVEKQRHKFPNINDAEFYERGSFVTHSQSRIATVKREMNSDAVKQKIVDDERNLAVRRAGSNNGNNHNNSHQTDLEKENTAFLVNNSTQQRLMLRQQDETLDELDDAVVRVGYMADNIHVEIESQNRMLDDLDEDLQNAEEQLGFVMGKLGKFLKTKSKCQLGTILLLCLVVMVLFFLVLYT